MDGNQENETQKLKKSFRLTIVVMIVIIILGAGSAFAWFSLSGRTSTNITPMAGTISEGDTVLLISNSAGGPFDKTCQLNLTGAADELKPLSTADLQHFFKATAQNSEGISVLYANADDRVNEDALHGTVYLQCLNAPCTVYFDRENLKLGSDAQALAAMRLGLKITSSSGTQTFIFRLDDMGATGSAQSKQTTERASAVVSAVSGDGQAVYVNDPAQNLSGYMAQGGGSSGTFRAGSQMLLQLQANEVATVEYWLYLEGCDEQCINPVQNRSSDFQLGFAGVDVGK